MIRGKDDKRSPRKLLTIELALFWLYILVNLIIGLLFVSTELVETIGKLIVTLFPLGLYVTIFSMNKTSALELLLFFRLIALHAFQVTMYYLFEDGAIETNMFVKLATSPPYGINMLDSAYLFSIFLGCVLYIPPMLLAIYQIRRKKKLSWRCRKWALYTGILLIIVSLILPYFTNSR
ncbi:MAG: hypothetical protein LBF27_01240 [Sphingobacterium sp.]|jgi:hypothetical protein|nr:hypothetical protein [Sphingobacterium sp.]